MLKLQGTNKVDVGNFLDKIISLKAPDSYKGKGFWFKYQKKDSETCKKKIKYDKRKG